MSEDPAPSGATTFYLQGLLFKHCLQAVFAPELILRGVIEYDYKYQASMLMEQKYMDSYKLIWPAALRERCRLSPAGVLSVLFPKHSKR